MFFALMLFFFLFRFPFYRINLVKSKIYFYLKIESPIPEHIEKALREEKKREVEKKEEKKEEKQEDKKEDKAPKSPKQEKNKEKCIVS